MKKLFIFSMLAFMSHISFVHSVNKFHHLNNLPRYANVKCECEQLERSFFFFNKSKKEKACDFLDNEIDELTNTIRHQVYIAKRKKDWMDSAATLAKLTRDAGAKVTNPDYHNQIEKAVRTIIPEAGDKVIAAECALLVELTANAVKKEFSK